MQISVRDNIPSNCSDTRSLLRYMSNDDYSITSRFDAAPASPLTYQALFWGLWSDVHLFSLSWQRRASRLQEMRKSAFCFHLTHNANIRLNRLLTSKALLSLLVAYTRLYTLFCLSVCPTIILFLHVCIDTRFTHQPCRRCTLGCRRSKYTMGRNERKCTIS